VSQPELDAQGMAARTNLGAREMSRPRGLVSSIRTGVMTARTVVVGAMLCGALSGAGARAQEKTNATPQQNARVEQTLRDLEHAWVSADMHKDPRPLQSIIAEGWFNTGSDGRIQSKKDLLADVRSNTDVIQSEENYDVTVRIFGKTAVLTGGTRERGTRRGKSYDEHYRWTDVWLERDGQWHAVVSQSIKVP
jgi:hypothetical protein